MAKEHSLEAVAPTSEAIERYEGDQPNAVSIRSLDDIKRLSLIFIKSGMFKTDDHKTDEQKMYEAGVKIIAGVEFGIQPFAAMRGINIIKGNAEMSANLMAAKVKSHPKYDYRVPTWTNDQCVVDFYEVPGHGQEQIKLGASSFSIADAKQAGLLNNPTWSKFPRNMLFARAISNGVRVYAPDIFYGAPVYVEGEISGEFDHKAGADVSEPVEAVIVDAAAPDVDQMGTVSQPPRERADTKKAVEAVEAEVAAEHTDEPVTQWDAAEVAKEATPDPAPSRKLDPKKTARIYKLGRLLEYSDQKMKALEARVSELDNNKEADEAIAILEEDLKKQGAES